MYEGKITLTATLVQGNGEPLEYRASITPVQLEIIGSALGEYLNYCQRSAATARENGRTGALIEFWQGLAARTEDTIAALTYAPPPSQ